MYKDFVVCSVKHDAKDIFFCPLHGAESSEHIQKPYAFRILHALEYRLEKEFSMLLCYTTVALTLKCTYVYISITLI